MRQPLRFAGFVPLRARRVDLAACVVIAGCGALVACAPAFVDSVDRLGDSRFLLKCQGALARCLVQADQICQGSRFTVESGWDARDYLGPQGVMEHEVRTSQATIHCGTRGSSLFGSDADHPKAPPQTAAVDGGRAPSPSPSPSPSPLNGALATSPAPASTKIRSACIPGATQTCVGSAACRGGQACLADGSGFSSCDCGSAPAQALAPADATRAPTSSSPADPVLPRSAPAP